MIRPPPKSPLFLSPPLSRSRPGRDPPRARGRRTPPGRGTRRRAPGPPPAPGGSCRNRRPRSEEHTSELQSQSNLVCRLLLEKKKKDRKTNHMESEAAHRDER